GDAGAELLADIEGQLHGLASHRFSAARSRVDVTMDATEIAAIAEIQLQGRDTPAFDGREIAVFELGPGITHEESWCLRRKVGRRERAAEACPADVARLHHGTIRGRSASPDDRHAAARWPSQTGDPSRSTGCHSCCRSRYGGLNGARDASPA